MCDTIIIDAKDILFCCGPCNSIDIEPEPILFNNNTEKYYLYKPHTGGRYPGYSWVLSNNKTLLGKIENKKGLKKIVTCICNNLKF